MSCRKQTLRNRACLATKDCRYSELGGWSGDSASRTTAYRDLHKHNVDLAAGSEIEIWLLDWACRCKGIFRREARGVQVWCSDVLFWQKKGLCDIGEKCFRHLTADQPELPTQKTPQLLGSGPPGASRSTLTLIRFPPASTPRLPIHLASPSSDSMVTLSAIPFELTMH